MFFDGFIVPWNLLNSYGFSHIRQNEFSLKRNKASMKNGWFCVIAVFFWGGEKLPAILLVKGMISANLLILNVIISG